jgi:hypothetical protein
MHIEHALEAARDTLERRKRAWVNASVRCRAPRGNPETAAAYDRYTRAAGRYAVLLAEAGRDPRRAEALHDMGAGALIGLSGASVARRAEAQRVLRTFAAG